MAAKGRKRPIIKLSKLKDEYLECRAFGHMWDDFIPFKKRQGYGTVVSLRCDRCTTERYDTIDVNGDVWAREYKYPDGYQVTTEVQGQTASKPDIRLELIGRERRIQAERKAAAEERRKLRVVK